VLTLKKFATIRFTSEVTWRNPGLQGEEFHRCATTVCTCGVPTRKGRRQTRNDAVQQLDHARFCRRERTKRGSVPASRYRSCVREGEFERGFGLFSSWTRQKRIGDKVARFRQLNADKPNVHHDALEFPDGEIVLVTRLCGGQHATVLQLPASPHSVNREVEPKHAAVVG
jgi:hypothetical protein